MNIRILGDDNIGIIHDFLGTEINTKNYFNFLVIPYLDKKIRFIPNNKCIYCYANAIERNVKYGVCFKCGYKYNINFVPYTFERFKKNCINKDWIVLSNQGFKLFNLALKNKCLHSNHIKSGILYEIIHGPVTFSKKSDNIRRIMQNNYIN